MVQRPRIFSTTKPQSYKMFVNMQGFEISTKNMTRMKELGMSEINNK